MSAVLVQYTFLILLELLLGLGIALTMWWKILIICLELCVSYSHLIWRWFGKLRNSFAINQHFQHWLFAYAFNSLLVCNHGEIFAIHLEKKIRIYNWTKDDNAIYNMKERWSHRKKEGTIYCTQCFSTLLYPFQERSFNFYGIMREVSNKV